MATVIYKPKYSIDTINSNFASKRSDTSVSTFISNNFSTDNSTLADTVNPNAVSKPVPVDLGLVSQIMVDYGDGPVSTGMNQCLVLINQNVQIGQFSTGNIFGDSILAGGNVDFRYVTDTIGSEIVIANLQMTAMLPVAPLAMQTSFNAVVLNIARDLRKGVYDPTNYLATIQYQSRQIAQAILKQYG